METDKDHATMKPEKVSHWSRTYSLLNTLTYFLLMCRKIWFKNCGKQMQFGLDLVLIAYFGGNLWCPCSKGVINLKVSQKSITNSQLKSHLKLRIPFCLLRCPVHLGISKTNFLIQFEYKMAHGVGWQLLPLGS